MSPEAWNRIEALFGQAVALAPEARPAFLARACDDRDVRRAVERLLRADDEGGQEDGDFLKAAVGKGVELLASTRDAVDTARVGSYRLIRRLGVGGMGEVYLAARADREYDKKVAIKLVRPGLDSRRILERFRRERQILANLEHPNIARLHDGGTTGDGMPYFVMEHIEGEPIDRFCDRHRLDLDARLELFRTVCAAVQFAHQSLVVHRDLKPSNILVTADGTVKLLDFGIAKLLSPEGDATDDADFTLTVERPLTLSYASPEQIRGELITTASDVYALGCLLYKLLADRRPFELSGLARREAEGIILHDPPQPPSRTLAGGGEEMPAADGEQPAAPGAVARARGTRPEALRRRLEGDLDTIVLYALRKESARRYGSAAQLADDVRRHLAGLPVAAHRDSWGYRSKKFVRRNRVLLAVGTLFLVLAAGAWINRTLQARQLARERDKAQAVAGLLFDLFDISDPSRSRGETITARELLDEGALRIGHSLRDQPEIQAMLYNTIGRVHRELGLYDSARPLIERGLELRRATLGERHTEVAQSLGDLGLLSQAQGDYLDAEAKHRAALKIYQQLPGDQRVQIAASSNDLALALWRQARFDEAESLFDRSLELYRSLPDDRSESIAVSLNNRGLILEDQGEYEEARDLFRQAVELGREIFAEPHPAIALYLGNLARQHQLLGDYDQAEDFYDQVLSQRRQMLGPDHPQTRRTLGNLTSLAVQRGNYAQAAERLRELVATARRVWGEDHLEVAPYLSNLAVALQRSGELTDEVEALMREALTIKRQHLGDEHPEVAAAADNLGAFLFTTREYAAAAPLYQRALEIRRAIYGEEHPAIAASLANLAQLYRARGRLDEAIASQTKALEMDLRLLGEDNPRAVLDRTVLGELHAAAGDLETASDLLERAAAAQRASDADHPALARVLTSQAEVLTRRGRLQEAESAVRQALAIREARLPADHWYLDETRSVLGGLFVAQGRYAEAEPLLTGSIAALESRHAYILAPALERLVALYQARGQEDEAERWRARQELLQALHPRPGTGPE